MTITPSGVILKIIEKYYDQSNGKNIDLETIASIFCDLKSECHINLYNNQKKDDKIVLSSTMINDLSALVRSGYIEQSGLGTSQRLLNWNNTRYHLIKQGTATDPVIESNLEKIIKKYIK